MRKILISIVVCLLLIWTIFFVVNGNKLLNVKGFIGLNDENKSVEDNIEKFTQVINVTYKNAYSNLEVATNKLLDNKTEYETQAILANLNDPNYTSEMYAVDYLWTRLGNFAKDEGVDMSINAYSTSVEHLYDLNFTVDGAYLGVVNFIYDIEEDSKLGFKIDDFLMKKSGDGKVTATFTCEKIYINISNTSNPSVDTSTNTNSTTSTQDTKEANTTSTTNTTTSGATSNSTTNSSTSTDKTNTTNSTSGELDVEETLNDMVEN